MKKISLLTIVILINAGFIFLECKQQKDTPEKIIAQFLVKQFDSFNASCKTLQVAVENNKNDEQQFQDLFLKARLAYKNFEWAAEYFEPATSRFVNGAPVQEIEISGQVFEPAGLQVIEGLLFLKYDTTKRNEIINQL